MVKARTAGPRTGTGGPAGGPAPASAATGPVGMTKKQERRLRRYEKAVVDAHGNVEKRRRQLAAAITGVAEAQAELTEYRALLTDEARPRAAMLRPEPMAAVETTGAVEGPVTMAATVAAPAAPAAPVVAVEAPAGGNGGHTGRDASDGDDRPETAVGSTATGRGSSAGSAEARPIRSECPKGRHEVSREIGRPCRGASHPTGEPPPDEPRSGRVREARDVDCRQRVIRLPGRSTGAPRGPFIGRETSGGFGRRRGVDSAADRRRLVHGHGSRGRFDASCAGSSGHHDEQRRPASGTVLGQAIGYASDAPTASSARRFERLLIPLRWR